jgi:hypothetical protein
VPAWFRASRGLLGFEGRAGLPVSSTQGTERTRHHTGASSPGAADLHTGCMEVSALTVEPQGQRLSMPTMGKDQLLAVIEHGRDAEQRIRHDRAQAVPFALLQGAEATDVARALGNWTQGEFKFAVGRWAQDLRRQGLIAPAELEALLTVDTTGVPDDTITTLRQQTGIDR